MIQPSTTFVIFGASGSLARLKIFPALAEMEERGFLSGDLRIVGFGRTPMQQTEFRDLFAASVKQHRPNTAPLLLSSLLAKVFYFAGDYESEKTFEEFHSWLVSIEGFAPRLRIAYFSVPPSIFHGLIANLAAPIFRSGGKSLRLVIEKPFGFDLASARRLRKELLNRFHENQIFLLDHYLGKESVGNLLSMRYANTMISLLLNRAYISNVQIQLLEAKDIEGRGGYYDSTGVLRDMVQSHMLQILSVLTMNLPAHETADAMLRQKLRLLRKIRTVDTAGTVVRGQYQGYPQEKGVLPSSTTETFIALKLGIHDTQWRGVPFYLRSGKALRRTWAGVVVEFKPFCAACRRRQLPPNRLIFQLQPTQEIQMQLLTKAAGRSFDFQQLTTGHPIGCGEDCMSEHAVLLRAVQTARRDLFLDFREITASWKAMDPIQRFCRTAQETECRPHTYPRESFGPKAADLLLAKDGFVWYNPDKP